MNKDRLKLCREFSSAKTIAECKKEALRSTWQELRVRDEIRRELELALELHLYKNRPWYKKLI